MNAIQALLDQPISQALGWTLIHFIWQGALIAVLYLSVSLILRRFAANVRYAAACGALLLMLVAPAITIVTMLSTGSSPSASPTVSLPPEWSRSNQNIDAALKYQDDQLPSIIEPESEPAPMSEPNQLRLWAQERLPRVIPWLLAIWFAGVLFLSLRFVGGLMMVHRLKRTETSSSIQLWQEKLTSLSRRLRVSRPVRLCESALVEVPTVIGWLRPVILLPASGLIGLSADQLEALLAHELAHIRRYDYLVNLVQTSIETLFFYHPAVWWISAQARQEREHCCDDLAVAACGDVLTYARALTSLEQLRRSDQQLAVAANGGSLLERIQRLLRPPSHHEFASGLAGFIALAALLILFAGAQSALLSRTAKAAVKEAIEVTIPAIAPQRLNQTATIIPTGVDSRPLLDRATTPPAAASSNEDAIAIQQSDAVTQAPSEVEPNQTDNAEGQRDFGSEMAAAGLTDLKAEHIAVLKRKGVTAEFVREMSALTNSKLTVDRVIAMKVHGVTAAFAEDFKREGLVKLTADELVAFRIHGVTSEFISELKSAGCDVRAPQALVAFRIHGVTPAFIQQMKEVGFANLSGETLTAFAIHGVTPVFVQTMRTFIHGKLTTEDLVGLSIHGVTPELIKTLEIMGYTNLSAQQLMAFRIHGITPEYIRAMQDAGYDHLTIEQLGELRVSGVTPAFIETIKSRGFTDATPHQLAVMRRLNILPSAQK